MKIINLTPHAIHLMPEGPEGSVVTIPPSGIVARCATQREVIGNIEVGGIYVPVHRTTFGKVTGLPDPQPDTIYVVSALVAQAVHREDICIVDDAVRDSEGRIIGARALARV